MPQVAEEPALQRIFPFRGMDHSGKPAVVAPGYVWYAQNFLFDRRSARQRPAREKLNAHAVGREGVQLKGNAVTMFTWTENYKGIANATVAGFSIEQWITPGSLRTTPGVDAIHFKGDETTAHLATPTGVSWVIGVGIPTGAPAGTAPQWYAASDGLGGLVQMLGGKPETGKRQHVALSYDDTADILYLIVDGVVVDQDNTYSGQPDPTGHPSTLLGDGATTGHKIEDVRFFKTYRTAAEILADMNDELEVESDQLYANFQGTYGTKDRLDDRLRSGIKGYFYPNFPSREPGPFAGQAVFPVRDAAQGSRAELDLTTTAAAAAGVDHWKVTNAAWAKNLASGVLSFGAQIAFRPLALLEKSSTVTKVMDWNIIIETDTSGANQGKLRAYCSDDPTKTVESSNVDWNLGTRIVVGVRRLGTLLVLYINGDPAVSRNDLITMPATAKDLIVGGYVGSGQPNLCAVDEITLYGADPGATVMTDHAAQPIPDRLDIGKTGNAVLVLNDDFGVTNGSATVTYAAASSALVGQLVYFPDPSESGKWIAYHIDSQTTGVSFTMHDTWEGKTNANQWAGIGTILYHQIFTDEWTTDHDRLTSDVPLTEAIFDEWNLCRGLDFYSGHSGGTFQEVTRCAGYVRSHAIPCAGMRRYHKEGAITTTLGVWGRTLYMLDDRWLADAVCPFDVPEECGRSSVRVIPGDYWAQLQTGSSSPLPEFVQGSQWSGLFELYPYSIRGKQVLYCDGDRYSGSGNGLHLLVYVEDGRVKIEFGWNDGGTETTESWQTDNQVVFPGRWQQVYVELEQTTSGETGIRIDGNLVPGSSTSGSWPLAGVPFGTTDETERTLFGLRDRATAVSEDQNGLIAEGFVSFKGLVHQVRIGDALEPAGSEPIEKGIWTANADTQVLLNLEEGEGWIFFNEQAASDEPQICNFARFAYPILSDCPLGDNEAPYSLATFRGVCYGTNGKGRQIRAEWTGDFDDGAVGWKVGFAGILPPQHRPTLTEGSGSMTAGLVQVHYVYLDSLLNRRSQPSETVEITLSGGTSNIQVSSILPSADPRVDRIEVYMTAPNQTYAGLVATVPNAEQTVTLDESAEVVRAGLELQRTNAVPPSARFLRFNLGRAYWGALEDEEGTLAVSQPDNEEAFDPLDKLKLDTSEWRPITGLGGQYGVIYAHVLTGIFRLVPGAGGIGTFQKHLVATRLGVLHGSGIVEHMGVEQFPTRDGLWAFTGSAIRYGGRPVEVDFLGHADTDHAGIQFGRPSWGVYDNRTRSTYWLLKPSGQRVSGQAFAQSRRIDEEPGWSVLDFYDISCMAETEDRFKRELIMQADSWGYVWKLTGTFQDVDFMGAVRESGGNRSLSGLWNTNRIRGPLMGDGARGYTLAAWDVDSDGNRTNFKITRLLASPAANTPTDAELEEALGFSGTNGSTLWLLGPIQQVLRFPWTPQGEGHLTKLFNFLYPAVEPYADETFWLRWYGATALSRNPLDADWDASRAQSEPISMDAGFHPGQTLSKFANGKALFVEMEYLGVKQLDLFEAILTTDPEGATTGASGN